MTSFKGTLETSDGTRASASLVIDETALTLSSGGETLGSWGFDVVDIRRTSSDRFTVDLADEKVIFVADNPVDFAYTVPGWVEAHKPKRRRGIQRRLEKRKTELVERIEKSGGRRRTQKLARSVEHVHTWREMSLPGGLIRRVCIACDHVSIDLRDADLPEETVTKPDAPSTTA